MAARVRFLNERVGAHGKLILVINFRKLINSHKSTKLFRHNSLRHSRHRMLIVKTLINGDINKSVNVKALYLWSINT